ncbi:Uncharacterised protein [Vibrio cholerae]|nr:Uncharacterised protein [Vibrio cholerae]
MFGFFEVNRSPVKYTVADQVNEGVSNRNRPKQFVVEDILKEDLFRSHLIFMRLIVIIGIVVFVLFNRW